MFADLIRKNRSYRRFCQDEPIPPAVLRSLVDLARLCASGSNTQPLKYKFSCDAATNDKVFATLAWAGYLKDWLGPLEGERPSAYIIILGDTTISKSFDVDLGIAAQSITLGAAEKTLGGCMIGSIQRNQLREVLNIDRRYEILLAIALGRPKETVVIEETGDHDIKYWRDDQVVHHVPKRSLDSLIVG